MKRLKKGFTLAEVLITLAIIGVVAAIVMPSVMSSYQYKSIGVKLGKFMSTVEGAARPFVVNNGNLSTTNADLDTDFVNDTFIFKSFDPEQTANEEHSILSYPGLLTAQLSTMTENEATSIDNTLPGRPVAFLKDGTAVQVTIDDTKYTGDRLELVPVEKYGAPVLRIKFDPQVQGLPTTAQKYFHFTVTELGYVFPAPNDNCTWQLYRENFTTTSKSFAPSTSCHTDSLTADNDAKKD